MSSANNNYANKNSLTQYQPLATVMDAVEKSENVPTGSEIVGGGGGESVLPSTNSSQQLMPPSDNDSLHGNAYNRNMADAEGANRGFRSLLNVGSSQWFTVIVLCFVNLINYMDRFTIAGVLTDIQTDFDIKDDSGGLLQTVFVLSYMVCAPIFGYMGDRFSRPWIMGIGVLLWSTTTLLGSFMNQFGWFLTFRALVGIGEASYSTIAPTIISDLFVNDMRSKMLALFYFAIPVGSGLGYIIGSETARIAGNWRWALRVTPILGIAAVVLIFLIKDPERGESEGSHNLAATSYKQDMKELCKNRSFMFSTAGFTCVAFVAGALSWWGPKFMHLGLKMQPGNEDITLNSVAFKFGAITMVAGLVGVPLGSYLSQALIKRLPNADPLLCAFGLLLSAPLMTAAMIVVSEYELATYFLIFFGQLALNMNWAIVADMLLYVVIPTRRSTAEAFQILISHAFGDAGSPYFVGLLSEAIKDGLRKSHVVTAALTKDLTPLSQTLAENLFNDTSIMTFNSTNSITESMFKADDDSDQTKFEALQYALFSTSFIEVIGGIFFLITAAFIVKDKRKAIQDTHDIAHQSVPNHPRVNIDEIS